MFKSTGKSGMRRAGGSGAAQSGRISGLHGLRASIHPRRHSNGAFMPDSPEEHGFDSNSSRISGVGHSK